jgi:N-carbamoyl-L-amino-acid hydrolase
MTDARVDAGTLWSDLMALGAITDPARPYTRRAFSPMFLDGRTWLTERMRDAGLTTRIDAAGNLVGRRQGSDESAGVILIGSHSDSVPSGGRFDGMVGVVAGIAMARALARNHVSLRHTIEIVDFLAEEPSEFGLSCIGSRGITGNLSMQDLELKNLQDETLGAALLRMGGSPAKLAQAKRFDIAAAFELHIEQGPVLESAGIDIGIVTAIVGITRIEVEFKGTAGHAGTTPMTQRRDPLIAAAHLIGWIRQKAGELAGRDRGHFVATVGVVDVRPGATNVIAKTARIVVDARSEERALMEEFRRATDSESRDAAVAARVERVSFKIQSDTSPSACAPALRKLLTESAADLACSTRPMASGAGHDMAFLSQVAPVAMVFIPCAGGRSHTPEEWASAEDVERGANVIFSAVQRFGR